MADINTIYWSQTPSSNNNPAPNGWPEGMSPSSVNDTARADRAAIKKWFDHTNPITTTGSGNNLILTYPEAPTITEGKAFTFMSNQTVSGSPTLNINGLGAYYIRDGIGGTLRGGDIAEYNIYTVSFISGTFRLWGTPRAPSTLSFAPTSTNTGNIYSIFIPDYVVIRDGLVILWKANKTSTGLASLQLDSYNGTAPAYGLEAMNGTELVSGDIQADWYYQCVFDTDHWVVLNVPLYQ